MSIASLKAQSFKHAEQCLQLVIFETRMKAVQAKSVDMVKISDINGMNRVRASLVQSHERLCHKLTQITSLMPRVVMEDPDLRMFTKAA